MRRARLARAKSREADARNRETATKNRDGEAHRQTEGNRQWHGSEEDTDQDSAAGQSTGSLTRSAPPRPQSTRLRTPASTRSDSNHSTSTTVSAAGSTAAASRLANPSSSTGINDAKRNTGAAMHQPHGISVIGPSSSNVSTTSSQQQHNHQHMVSLESPLPPAVQRNLGDRSNEKRKSAALEIEALIKSLQEANNMSVIQSVISLLSKDFCTSMNSNYRKGGLVGLAATAIGLMQNTHNFLNLLLPPVLHCFDDPESRVRYYACESLYNIVKVSRQSILPHFNQIFEGLTKLFADVDVDVKNGANLLDRLIKDIVTETQEFQVDQFLPILQTYIRRTNPFIRQLIVGWITLLDSIPDVSMLTYLPEFLEGLFNMLSDSNREIRQAADAALSEFLRGWSVSSVVEFGPIISILVVQCQSKERLNRLTAITWLQELIHHPHSGGDALLPFHADILGAIMWCISDGEKEIRLVAERANDDLLALVRDTKGPFALPPLLETLTKELLEKEDVPTKMAALRWINMLMEKRKSDMDVFAEDILPVLLRTLSDPSDPVVLLDLQVLSRISLSNSRSDEENDAKSGKQPESVEPVRTEEAQFQLVLNAILNLFAQDRQLLETRGSLIIRKLCVLLNAKSVYIRMANTLASYEIPKDESHEETTLHFIGTMVQTLNLILLTASELHDLRTSLARSFQPDSSDDGADTFAKLFQCWCHNPVATFSLCLLAQVYDLSFALVKRFSQMDDITVGFLMQIDKLVHLLESPIFVHLRLQLLNVEAPYHTPLLRSIYGVLMCLPQGDAFRLLNDRLATVCNLRDNLGLSSTAANGVEVDFPSIVSQKNLDMDKLLDRFDKITWQHHQAHKRAQSNVIEQSVHQTSEIVNPSAPMGGPPPLFSSPQANHNTTMNGAANGRSLGAARRPADSGATMRITVQRSTR